MRRIQDWIGCGDLFQANLTACCSATLPADRDGDGAMALRLFQRLRRHCPAPFAGLVVAAGAASGEAVISSSPNAS